MRGEVVYLLTLAMFTVGYVCGIGLELKSAITVCTLPAAFFVLMNWYIRRETTYKDILLIVGASVVFWCAQYTTKYGAYIYVVTLIGVNGRCCISFCH